jgi:hypothetical protein
MQNKMVGVETRLVCGPVACLRTKEIKVLVSEALGAVYKVTRDGKRRKRGGVIRKGGEREKDIM